MRQNKSDVDAQRPHGRDHDVDVGRENGKGPRSKTGPKQTQVVCARAVLAQTQRTYQPGKVARGDEDVANWWQNEAEKEGHNGGQMPENVNFVTRDRLGVGASSARFF